MENDGFPDTRTEGQFKALESPWVYSHSTFPCPTGKGSHWVTVQDFYAAALRSMPPLELVLVAAMKIDPLFFLCSIYKRAKE